MGPKKAVGQAQPKSDQASALPSLSSGPGRPGSQDHVAENLPEHKRPSRPSLPSGPSQEASQGPTGSKRMLGPQQSPKDPGSRSTLARAAQVSGSGGPCPGSPAAVLGSFPKDTLSRRRAARPRRYASQPASPTSRPATPTSPWPPGSAGSFSVHQCHTVTSPLRASPQCHSDIRPFRAPLHRHPPPSHPLRAPRSVTPTLFPVAAPPGPPTFGRKRTIAPSPLPARGRPESLWRVPASASPGSAACCDRAELRYTSFLPLPSLALPVPAEGVPAFLLGPAGRWSSRFLTGGWRIRAGARPGLARQGEPACSPDSAGADTDPATAAPALTRLESTIRAHARET